MKYSLRSLMAVVTLVGVIFGGRVEYLRRRADFHGRQPELHILNLHQTKDLSRVEIERLLQFEGLWQRYFEGEFGRDYRAAYYHRTLSDEFDKAISRPWKIVNESPPGWDDISKSD